MRCFVAWLALLALWCCASPAAAQTTEQRAAAQLLFDEARKLHAAGKKDEACQKFQQSLDLDRAVGTQLNLARCYEETGKLASAWIHYNEVAGAARAAGQAKRAAHARQQADKLKPKLSTLTIHAPAADDVVVKHNGAVVPTAALGTAVPVDAGSHTIAVTADGKEPWENTVEVAADAAAVVVDVPPLSDVPAAPAVAPPPPAPADSAPPATSGDATVAWVLGGVSLAIGVGGVATGTALRLMALSKDEDSLAQCLPSDPNRCSAEGAALRDDAKTLQTASTIAWAAGGAFTVTGVVLLIHAGLSGTSDDDEAVSWQPHLGPHDAGLSFRAKF